MSAKCLVEASSTRLLAYLPYAVCLVPRATCKSIVEHSPLTNEAASWLVKPGNEKLKILLGSLFGPLLLCIANQMSNAIFIKLINISAARTHAAQAWQRLRLRLLRLPQLRWMHRIPAAAGAGAVRPRLKYALGIICAAARNLPHAHISDSRRQRLR